MSDRLRVLHIEDEAVDALLVARALKRLDRPYDLFRVSSLDEAREAITTASWDVVLADWSLVGAERGEVLVLMRERAPHVPVILVSAHIGEESAIEAMRSGATDYVPKDRLPRLVPAVERALDEARERQARRRAEEATERERARFRAIVEHATDGVIIARADGALAYVSEPAARIFGRPVASLLDTPFYACFRDSEHASARAAMASLLAEPAKAIRTLRHLLRPDGSERVVEIVVTNRLADDAVRGMVANVRDLTEAEHTRGALLEVERQLRQAQKMDALGRLAGGVAHDFNNILSVILSYTEMLVDEQPEGSEMVSDLRQIERAAKQAAALTRQLLLFSRKEITALRAIDLNEVVARMETMLRRVVGEDIQLVSQLHARGAVRADPQAMEQVVMNLAVNARDAMAKGGRLVLATRDVVIEPGAADAPVGVRPGSYVALEVQDEGVGMDEATQLRALEPFFTTKPSGKGTGLGLSTVFGIVQQAQGNIAIDSKVGEGTTVRILLPRLEEAGVAKTVHPPALARRTAGGETILLVEDDSMLRMVAERVLRREGYDVLAPESPSDAVDLLAHSTRPIHLLLTDLVMPIVGGLDLAERVRALRPDTKILLMSGYTDDEVLRRGVRDGTIPFLQKPVSRESLIEKVRQVLDDDPSQLLPSASIDTPT